MYFFPPFYSFLDTLMQMEELNKSVVFKLRLSINIMKNAKKQKFIDLNKLKSYTDE